MCKFLVKLYKKHLNNQVEKYWQVYHFDMEPGHTSYNNEGDAFKHCYWQAEMTLFIGKFLANKIGIYWEDQNKQNTPQERKMDLHNNEVGQDIGKQVKNFYFFWFLKKWDDLIAERVMRAMNTGELITKPE